MKPNKSFLFNLVCFSLLLVVLTSCNKGDVDQFEQDRIYGSYELYYDTDVGLTYQNATFRLDSSTGIKVQLADDANVYFEGNRLSWVASLGGYQRSDSGIIASGEFEYIDLDGNPFTNSVSINLINYPIITDTVDRSEDYVLTWSGDALAANESVRLSVSDANSDTKIFEVNITGSGSITADSVNLKELAAGASVWSLDRIYSPPISNATPAGGDISGIFRPISQVVYLK